MTHTQPHLGPAHKHLPSSSDWHKWYTAADDSRRQQVMSPLPTYHGTSSVRHLQTTMDRRPCNGTTWMDRQIFTPTSYRHLYGTTRIGAIYDGQQRDRETFCHSYRSQVRVHPPSAIADPKPFTHDPTPIPTAKARVSHVSYVQKLYAGTRP